MMQQEMVGTKKIVVITTPDARQGFELAGIVQLTTEGPDAAALLGKAVSDPGNGLVILDERLARDIGEDALRGVERNWQGVLVLLPLPGRMAGEGDEYALRLIRRAIGYHVRLRL